MQYILAIINAHDWTMRFVTTFSTEIFSLLNSIIYFHKAVQELQRAHEGLTFAAFLYAIIGAIGTMLLATFLSTAESWTPLFHRYIRMGLVEYAAAISIIVFIAMPHIGELASLDKQTLQVSDDALQPSDPNRSVFFVHLWQLPVPWIFAAMVSGFIITILFFFDHEVSSIICTTDRYGIRKPRGFAWDIILLGTTTALCGILGIPPANGLLPQAPLHSESLLYTDPEQTSITNASTSKTQPARIRLVHEQRWSAFLHSAAILIFITPPLQRILGLTPTSVLAGLFMFMGEQSLAVNPILYRFIYLLTPPSELPNLPKAVKSYHGVHTYTITQILVTAGIFIVTLTKGAPAFPVIVMACVTVRLLLMKRIWQKETLRFVDAWACRAGTPEGEEADEEKEKDKQDRVGQGVGNAGAASGGQMSVLQRSDDEEEVLDV